MKVLIIDGDWHFLDQARSFLETRGDLVVHEVEPKDALRRCRQWQPEVVFVSAELGAVHNGALLPGISAMNPRPAVIVTAAMDRFGKAWHAWRRGGDELLFKPLLQPRELHVAIMSALKNCACDERRIRALPLSA